MCQNRLLGVVGGVLGRNTLLILQKLFTGKSVFLINQFTFWNFSNVNTIKCIFALITARLSPKYLGQRYILNLRLSGCSGITSSKYRNVKIDVVSCPNLRRLLGIMYHMLKHGSTRFWPFWWLIWGFIRGFSHLTSHTGLCETVWI